MSSNGPSRGLTDHDGADPSQHASPVASSSRLSPLLPEPTHATDKKRRRQGVETPEDLSHEAEQSSSQRLRLNDGSRRDRSPDFEATAREQRDEHTPADAISNVGSSSSQQQPHPFPLAQAERQTLALRQVPSSHTSGTSPPRVRRPPVSQSAWSALRERIGASSSSSSAPSTARTSSSLTAGEHVLPMGHGRTSRPETNDSGQSSGVPSDHPTARSLIDSVVAGSPNRLAIQPSSGRWGPGAVIAALMSDILGFNARNAPSLPSLALGATPTTPAQAGPGATPATTSTPPFLPRPPTRPPYQRNWTAMPPPPPSAQPSGSRSTAQSASPDRVRLFPLGGTSVVVQGAMVARLNRPEAEAARDSAGPTGTVEDRSSSAPSSSQLGSESSNRVGGPETPAATTGTTIPTWGDTQASMLTRLLSIAAAATASSLTSGPAISPVGIRADGPSHTRAPTDRLQPHQAQVPAGSPADAVPLPSSSPGSRSGAGNGIRGVTPLHWPLHDAGNSPNNGSLRRSIASLTSRVFGRFVSQSGRGQARSSGDEGHQAGFTIGATDWSDEEANEVDMSLGAGSRSYATGGDSNGTSTNGADDSDARRALSMSEMLQEAIRDGVGPDSASDAAPDQSTERTAAPDAGVTSANEARIATATPVAPQVSQGEYHRRVLSAARENRLQRGPEGSFERWLYDLSDDLDHAVRTMISTQPSQGAATAPVASATGADTDTAGGNQSLSGESVQDRRALDVEEGQLSFFRLFRLDGRGSQPSTINGLVPCVVVGVRSLSMSTQSVTPQNAVERFRNLLSGTSMEPASGQVREQSTQTDRVPPTSTRNENVSTASELDDRPSMDQSNASSAPQTEGATATADVGRGNIAEQDDSSRFLLFVSGGHYPLNHPLLSTPSNVAARDLMILIEVLSNLNAANAANAAAGQGGRVTKEDLQANGPSIRRWGDIKTDAVEVDAKEGTKINEGGTGQLAPRAGERCAVCLEEWSDEDAVRILNCRHAYHQACVDQWLLGSSNSCPMCRQVAVGKTARQTGVSDTSPANAENPAHATGA